MYMRIAEGNEICEVTYLRDARCIDLSDPHPKLILRARTGDILNRVELAAREYDGQKFLGPHPLEAETVALRPALWRIYG